MRKTENMKKVAYMLAIAIIHGPKRMTQYNV